MSMNELNDREVQDSLTNRTLDLIVAYQERFPRPAIVGTILSTLLDIVYFDLKNVEQAERMILLGIKVWIEKRKNEEEKNAANT